MSYVTASGHSYVTNPERREEAGTPSIVENIRAGMVLQLKADMDELVVEHREQAMTNRLAAALHSIPGIELLGPVDADRIGVFSFNIRVRGKLLHHNYVVALLNDLFGIQARGGCSCAGPYGHALLQIDDATTECHARSVASGYSAFRPGWARLGVNWFFRDEDVDKIAAALAFIAARGLELLSEAHALADAAPDQPCPAEVTMAPEEEALRWFWMPREAVNSVRPFMEKSA